MAQEVLNPLSTGLPENATFNTATIKNASNLGAIFRSSDAKWVPTHDWYPDGKIPVKNLTDYKIGSNGIVFGPQAGLRASVTHLNRYMMALSNNGVTLQGYKMLEKKSVLELTKPHYQYHGKVGGALNDYHRYALGLYRTTYFANDAVIPHSMLIGHLGESYGLISAYYYWQEYTFAYAINGAFNGYEPSKNTIYELTRVKIANAVSNYVEQKSKTDNKTHPTFEIQ